MTKAEIRNIEPEYVHSSNTVFNFMKKAEYLEKALSNKCLLPRYCEENIEYLNLFNGESRIETVSVLQKCFCDIPLHRITENFLLDVSQDKSSFSEGILPKLALGITHTGLYGEYGIAFSKSWAQKNNLQPVYYINPNSEFAEQFKETFEYVLNRDDIADLLISDVLSQLACFKPLYGKMTRKIEGKSISVFKNFYDECEWRFVPKQEKLEKHDLSAVIFDEEIKKLSNQISDRLEDEKFKELRLDFDYQDIRYLIVPDNAARTKLVDFIMTLETEEVVEDKYLLISKLLVLEDIKKDF